MFMASKPPGSNSALGETAALLLNMTLSGPKTLYKSFPEIDELKPQSVVLRCGGSKTSKMDVLHSSEKHQVSNWCSIHPGE